MNFTKPKTLRQPRTMLANDVVIAYERHDSLTHFSLKMNGIFNNKYGAFHHNDIIGRSFGSKIKSRCSNGWLYVLEPTPELWSNAVKSRTQIVNEQDAAFITLKLDVFPGCRVIESGTGSGCMTLSLARSVYPSGHVYSYEFNAVRAEAVRDEFNR